MEFATTGLAILRVLGVGLLFGAGLPALFSFGLVLFSRGQDQTLPDGTVQRGNRLATVGGIGLFAVVILAVLVGVLWITRKSLDHYLGISLF